MYAASRSTNVIDLYINTEANQNGFIDFNSKMTSFKAQVLNINAVNLSKLKFVWKITDASGAVFA
jgi:hypothetical protein